jgi:hypothetical protein
LKVGIVAGFRFKDEVERKSKSSLSARNLSEKS